MIEKKLNHAFCQNVTQALERNVDWIGDKNTWYKKRGGVRHKAPYFELVYGDFIFKYENLKID